MELWFQVKLWFVAQHPKVNHSREIPRDHDKFSLIGFCAYAVSNCTRNSLLKLMNNKLNLFCKISPASYETHSNVIWKPSNLELELPYEWLNPRPCYIIIKWLSSVCVGLIENIRRKFTLRLLIEMLLINRKAKKGSRMETETEKPRYQQK